MTGAWLFAVMALACSAAPWRGVDRSQLGSEDDDGAASPFRAKAGGPLVDALELLQQSGANTFRMRMWNDPCADGRCDPAKYAYAGLDGVLKMASRCKAAGLDFALDFHYSDWWADPGQQYKPRAWHDLSFEDLTTAMHDFTHDTLVALVGQGTPPVAVQIGNEITNGMLWHNESLGEPCTNGGKLWNCETDTEDMWLRLATLVDAGIRAVRAASPSSLIAIHTDLGNHIQEDGGIDWVVSWHENLSKQLLKLGTSQGQTGQPFDLIGLSMYPQWDQGHTFQNIAQLPKLAAAFPGARIYIAETSYPAAGNDKFEKHYAATPAGQLQYLQDVIESMDAALPQAQNGGVLWWESEHDGWKSLFDSEQVARPALLQGFAGTGSRMLV